jgi:cell division septation protein DedD
MVTKKVLWVLPLVLVLGVAGCSRQQSDWEKTRAANTTDAYEVFLKKYPSGEFSAQAQARVKELYEERDWLKARDTDTAEAYQAFLKQYPEGKYTEEARIRVENFTLAATPNGAAPADGSTAPAETPANTVTSAPAQSPAPPKPAAALVPKVTAPNTGGAYGVQLGAFKSNADSAHQHWTELAKKYPKALSALTPKVSPKKTSAGTLYRLQVVDLSEHHARAICKALGSPSCVVLKPGHG